MLYRACIAAIVFFWLFMTVVLIRKEVRGDALAGLPVPIGYVERLVFRHEVPSDLVVYAQRRRTEGSIHLQPRRVPATADAPAGESITATGNFLLNLPTISSRRAVFHAVLELENLQSVRHVEVALSLHERRPNSPGTSLQLDGDPIQTRWHYRLAQGTDVIREETGTPQELIAQFNAGAFGFDTRSLSSGKLPASTTPASLSARRARLRVGEDEIDTYEVTVHHADNLDTTIHVNQLGQILAVRTPFGFDLYDETVSP